MFATTAPPFPNPAMHHRDDADPDVRGGAAQPMPIAKTIEEAHVRRPEVPLDQRGGRQASGDKTDPGAGPEQAEAEIARAVRAFGEEDLGDVHRRVCEHHDRPRNEDAHQGARAPDDREALGQVAPAPAPDRPLALEQPRRNPGDEERGERERARVDPVGEMGPRRGDERAAGERPGGGRRPLDELDQGVRGRELASADRGWKPREHRRAEERVPDPSHGCKRDDRGGRPDERERREDGEPADIGGDHQPLARQPVDERTEKSTPMKTAGKMFAIRSAPTHQPECVRS